MNHPITIAVDNSAYRLQRVDARLEVRRISEITDQVGRAQPERGIRVGFAFINRHLRQYAQLILAQFSRRKQQADKLAGK